MSEAKEHSQEENGGQEHDARQDQGVLAKLPRTRPQRASPRRAAARARMNIASPATSSHGAPSGNGASSGNGATSGTATASKRRAPSAGKLKAAEPKPKVSTRRPRTSASKGAAARRRVAAPRQGFESESAGSDSVQPPGGLELVTSAAEIVGELTRAGLSKSERLLKNVVSRLPLN